MGSGLREVCAAFFAFGSVCVCVCEINVTNFDSERNERKGSSCERGESV